MSSCKIWEHFSGGWDTFQEAQIHSPWGGEWVQNKKKKERFCSPSPSCEAQPKLLCTVPWWRSSLSAASAWEILHKSPGSYRRDMGLYERCKASKTSTIWHLSVHLCGHTDPLPASICLGQAQSKCRITPKPREDPKCQLLPVRLGLLHIAVVDLCFVCCASQT